jgi:hypothetical protein
MVGTAVGVLLWLIGARFGRVLLTLLAVAAGTFGGMKMPEWYGWSIDPMAPGVVCALILGLTAYALYRFYVGAALALTIAAWMALGAWILLGHATYHPPVYSHSGSLPKYLSDVWNSLPADMRRWLPYLAVASFIAAMTIAVLWPKFGATFFWSFAGASIAFCMASTALLHFRPKYLDNLPSHFGVQLASMGGAVLIGMLSQWYFTPRPKKEKTPAHEEQPEPSSH